ncbi:thiol-disulfide isomerase/thioredoxin [Luteibacter sp. Sphag1AF]|uniref:thioredoxin family protein n=1 Tax=Luteibacter sp. Sphag1AF TaxID=2587031 RepID=UPI0016213526|nr:thioredoxin family protein [Luteibacter sp. Sphag1AF]MBB3227880.1 thiol-disulfide isomerase/thioredoxin [Luteibacter sp. Sphag1AF]
MHRLVAASLLALAAPAFAATHEGPATIDAALAQARKDHKPVLIDFQAVWCYSCYYMASHVLNGPEWTALNSKVVFVEADADTPDGQAWMKKLRVQFLPSYVVIGDNGDELGRILAERPRDKFYPEINTILAGDARLDKLKADSAKGSLAATAAVLDTYQSRYQGDEGMAWFASLPATVRNVSDQDKRVALAKQRLLLLQAKAAKNYRGIAEAATKSLAGNIGCDRPYVLDDLIEASGHFHPETGTPMLTPQKAPMDNYLATQVFTASPACADQRSAVITAADLDAALGDKAAEEAVLRKAIDLTREKLGSNLGSDRNLADNLRAYYVRAKDTDALNALQKDLIAAYPDDYVYPYRYGRSLTDAGKPDEALPYLEKAASKAYGANRFAVATARVKALRALHRDNEARKVVDAVVASDGKAFPEQSKKLKDSLTS